MGRPDTKQVKVNEFVEMFNKFTDDYPDLREDIQVKEELHQRTDTLADRLWDISEERKKQAIEEKTKIMTCGYVEF